MGEMNHQELSAGMILEGKYVIQKTIGVGGFGIIYLAEDRKLKINVAIKEYFPSELVTRAPNDGLDLHILGNLEQQFKKGMKQFEQEARYLFLLRNCAGIIDIMNLFYENHTAYMVLEYINGRNLREYLEQKENKLSWESACEVIRPIIEALIEVHKIGIVHCDISPENIMITSAGTVKIIDFGAGYVISAGKGQRNVLLRRGYSPPELYQESGQIGPWTDVYSVCATLYRIIMGEKLPELVLADQKIDAGLFMKKKVDSLPVYLQETISRGLEAQIDQRIQNMSDLLDYLYGNERFVVKRRVWAKPLIVGCGVISIVLIIILYHFYVDGSDDAVEIIKSQVVENSAIGTSEGDFDNTARNDISLDVESTIIGTDGITNEQRNEIQYTDEEHLFFEKCEEGIVVTGSDNTVTDLILPDKIDGDTVVRVSGIGGNVTSLILPDTVVEISDYAFRNCAYLKYIYIPASVEKIGTGAFDNCFSLSDIGVSDENIYFYVLNGSLCSVDGRVIYDMNEQNVN